MTGYRYSRTTTDTNAEYTWKGAPVEESDTVVAWKNHQVIFVVGSLAGHKTTPAEIDKVLNTLDVYE